MNEHDTYLVTVCITTYNHEKFIKECLEAVLSQKTSFNFKIQVSDDCSTDKTFEIIQEYSKKFPNVFVKSRCGLPKSIVNGRPNGNQNALENLDSVDTKYVAYSDGDDVWGDDYKLEKQIQYLEKNLDVALTCSSKNQIINETLIPGKSYFSGFKFSYRWLYFFNPIPASSVVFRKIDFKWPPSWYFEELSIGDWPLWFIISKDKRIYKFKESFLNYRVHPGGDWTQRKSSERVKTYLEIIRNLKKLDESILLSGSYTLHFVRYLFTLGIEKCFKKD